MPIQIATAGDLCRTPITNHYPKSNREYNPKTMERAASAGLRICLRIRTTGSCMAGKGLQSRSCIASSICSSRSLASSGIQPSTRPTSSSTSITPRIIRPYSSTQSSIRGTVGAGEAGIKDEAQRTAEALVAPDHLNEKERQIWDMLMAELQCTELHVQDISGGCGSMYGIEIVSERFRGLNMLKQQRLVNQVLGEEIKKWHGVQLKTRAP